MPNYAYLNLGGYRLKIGSWLFQDYRWSFDRKHQKLMAVIANRRETFTENLSYVDRNNRILSQILITLDQPIHNRSNLSADQNYLLKYTIDELVNTGCLRQSESPFSSPVRTQYVGDKIVLDVDYSLLNANTINRNYAVPSPQSVLLSINESNLFSKIVIKDAFHQLALTHDSMAKTAFATQFGHFEFTTMHRGLKNAEDFLQMLLDDVLLNADKRFVKNYQAEILIHTTNFDHQLLLLGEVLREIDEANLKIDPEESLFVVDHVKFLGWIISSLGIQIDWEKSTQIGSFPIPKDNAEVRSFLELIQPYRCFVNNYGQIALPLNNLLQQQMFYWGIPQQNAFDGLKQRIITAPPIPFKDASHTAPIYSETPL